MNAPGAGVVRAPDLSLADPQVQALVTRYVADAAPLANRVIGRIRETSTPTQNALGESTVGDVIADAQLAATAAAGFGEAKVAFMNPGGIRGGVGFLVTAGGEGPGEVTYGEAFTVQPFGNTLVTKTMTGDMIRRLLQQQFLATVRLATAVPPRRRARAANLVDVPVRVESRRRDVRREDREDVGERRRGDGKRDVPGDDEQLPRHRRRRLYRLQ